MNNYHATRQALQHAAAPLVGCSVVIGFTVSPLLRFADPTWLAVSGAILAIALIANYFIAFTDFREPWWTLICWITAGSMIQAVVALQHAGSSSRANDRRCLAIQRDMLSARPRRSDDPDLFQALGCRPQGGGSVYAPRSAGEGTAR
jgi:hypothetical protein